MQYLLIRRPQVVTITVELRQLQFSQNTNLLLTQELVQRTLSALQDSYGKIKDTINRALSIEEQKLNTHREIQACFFSFSGLQKNPIL